MNKVSKLFLSHNLFILIIFSLSLFSIKSDTILEINEDVPGSSEYKKVSFESERTKRNHFFKYTVSDIPKSLLGAFRIDFDVFNEASLRNSVFCTFVDEGTSDSDLEETLRQLTLEDSACVGEFKIDGKYDGLIKYSTTKKKLGIYLVAQGGIPFTATVFIRTVEKFLSVEEQEAIVEELYSLVPHTVVISDFRDKASRILFYSYTRELQMYYSEETSVTYPERLFSGNVMSVYTNPNMVHQKYHDANYMVLLTRGFDQDAPVSESFQFQVKLYPSNYLLDYYVSDNLEGRSKNSPLSINMTDCGYPYYIVLNYNKPEKEISLYIDQIYGKVESLSVATTFSSLRWEDMIVNDMQEIKVSSRKYTLPKQSKTHMDVYKVECEIPILLNFYYVDESASIPYLNYGSVAITTLKAYKSISLPFVSGITSPELTIEVFNPIKLPLVYIDDGQNEVLVDKNTFIKSKPFNTINPIVIKERDGDSNSRVIVKVGFKVTFGPDETVTYNEQFNVYVFSFPNDEKRMNYTYANLVTKGAKNVDNVKYCYGTNIGSAIIPSKENCYRVSESNSYTLKLLNPLVMDKDYDVDENLNYYLSIQPVDSQKLEITPELHTYDTNERNIEGVASNLVIESSGIKNSILTAPKNRDVSIFVQVQQCDNSQLTMKILNAYDTSQTVVTETTVDKKNFYKTFNNILLETEIELRGTSSTNVFVKHAGIRNNYYPSIKDSQTITFNSELNQLIVESPINNYENMKYIVLVSPQGGLSSKGITLCSFTNNNIISSFYNKTVESYNEKTSININFKKVGLEAGQTFEAIVFSEQKINSKMSFVSNIITGTVGEIDEKSITEINSVYDLDNDYVFSRGVATSSGLTYYFSYLPSQVFDVPVGSFNIELDTEVINGLSSVDCAFVDDGEDAVSMIEAVEDIIDSRNPYCIGGRSTTNGKVYRYVFKYSYTPDKKPRRLVIKISNGYYTSGGFTIFLRKGENIYLEQTDFQEQREYGKQEEYRKSIVPYIVDLEKIRGNDTDDYVSKVLIYSRYFEMQMYYINENSNAPSLLFSGNIMLVYTKLTLAEQKYHSTKLVLLSENISGQEHSSLGNQFRFHTKMFKSDAQIEYFVSNNPTGRTLNYPLSLEMNTCTSTNNKYYYILNYNRAEDERILYLDLVFGSMRNAKIVNEITEEKWDNLILTMKDIVDYTATLSSKSQHIDIVEIECNTPLLANVYYNYEGQEFNGLELGDIAVKNLNGRETTTLTLDIALPGFLYYSISLFNPKENPDVSFKFGDTATHRVTENSLESSFLISAAKNESIVVTNNGQTTTRFILKIGYDVETKWVDEKENIDGTLYSQDNKYIYRFPKGDNKKNFTNVELNVKPLKKGTQEEADNVKFCYSTSIGIAIDVSLENCFRTGKNIPYSLTFINPLISPKNYKLNADYYYVTIRPFYSYEFISLDITENKYETNERNIEGIGNIIKLENDREKSTILSIPEVITNANILLQLQLCTSSANEVNYKILNAYSHEQLYENTLYKSQKIHLFPISNNLMESELKIIGQINDTIFAKHIGLNNNQMNLQDYTASFDKSQNVAIIYKPIYNEEFRFTILVGRKGTLSDYSLCTFAEKSEQQYKDLADYVSSFTSVSSNIITHYIDFSSIGYSVGDEFEFLVYAVQANNAKLEILYEVVTSNVGKVEGVLKLDKEIPGKPGYISQLFARNATSNYFYYYYPKIDIKGYVSSLKIKQQSSEEEGMRISKVGCTFVEPNSSQEDMMRAVNNAMNLGTSVCVGESQSDTNGFDALINAKQLSSGSGKRQLVIQVIYGLGDDEKENKKLRDDSATFNITLKIEGESVDSKDTGYYDEETLTLVPYVLDLLKIRESEAKYISKVLLFSSTREMQMYYLSNSGAPVELFSGNIMLVYTNPELIEEKYYGATTMILITDSFSKTQKKYFGEQFKFKTKFFYSETTIQYYVSANPSGRLLNNPTAIEMLSCDQPYYYILNYNEFEGERVLHLDNIFGEVDTKKFSTQLNDNNWDDFVRNMAPFEGNDYKIEAQSKYHIDVLEVTCKIPLLLNVYYTDPIATKKTNLDQGDISIITLSPLTNETLSFKFGLSGDFIYSFNIWRENNQPNFWVEFDSDDILKMTINGIFTKRTNQYLPIMTIQNRAIIGNDKSRVIFKFGYDIEKTFTKIENDIYNLQTNDRPANLFAYIFRSGEDRLNYTKVDFLVTTNSSNVKFCYSSNLGAFIDPSLQNCFRVGKVNPYTISILNPYVMYKDYYTNEDVMNYYVSFRTEDIDLNITIIPTLTYYATKNRNEEGYPKSLTLKKEVSTILTSPVNHTKYLFVQMHVCTKDTAVGYNFTNAYNNTSLNEQGAIPSNSYNNYRNIQNTKLDTLLNFENLNAGNQDEEVKIFVKHIGTNEPLTPIINEFKIEFDEDNKAITFDQPIVGEDIRYTVYLDKKGNLNNKYNLCTFAEVSKLGHYSESFDSDEEKITYKIDFDKSELKGYESFDLFVLAQEKNNGQFMILSNTISGDVSEESNIVLVIILVVLAIILVGGGVFLFICLRNYKNKPMENVIIAKPTNLDDIQDANKGEKMLDSMAQSQAYENQK